MFCDAGGRVIPTSASPIGRVKCGRSCWGFSGLYMDAGESLMREIEKPPVDAPVWLFY